MFLFLLTTGIASLFYVLTVKEIEQNFCSPRFRNLAKVTITVINLKILHIPMSQMSLLSFNFLTTIF